MKTNIRVAILKQIVGTDLCAIEGRIVGDPPYHGCSRGVLHVHGEYFIIYDQVPRDEEHDWSYGFQFVAGANVESAERLCQVEIGDRRVSLHASNGLILSDVALGRLDPPAGWVSDRYGEIQPATQVRFSAHEMEPVTAFLLHEGEKYQSVHAATMADGAVYFQIRGSGFCDHVLLPGPSGVARVERLGFEVCGDAIWLRDHESRIDVRLCGVTSARYGAWSIQSQTGTPIAELSASFDPANPAETECSCTGPVTRSDTANMPNRYP